MNNQSKSSNTTQVIYAYPPNIHRENEIDYKQLWDVIWRGKWLIVLITTVFAISSIIIALWLPNVYRSESLLAPSDEAQGGGLSGMAGQLGGLASLAGINLNGGGAQNKIAMAIEVVKSRQFITNFIKKYDLLPQLLGVNGWNQNTGKLQYNPAVYNEVEHRWVRDVEPPMLPKPSDWEAYKEFMRILTVSQDKSAGFVTLAVEHYSPFVAQHWTELLVREVNEVIREKDVNEAQRSINYLQGKLSQVSVAEMRNVFYQLIEEQTKTIMLAEVRDEYIFSTIDPPIVPEEKHKPKRALICVLGTMLGGMLAVMIVFVRHLIAQDRKVD